MNDLAHVERGNEFSVPPTAQRIEMMMLPARTRVADFIRSTHDEKLKRDHAQALISYAESIEFPRLLKDLHAAAMPASREEILRHIGMLIAAFPSMARADSKAYGAVLGADIWAIRPSKFALDAAMTTLRRTATFCPSVGEVMLLLEEREATASANLRILAWLQRLAVEAARDLRRRDDGAVG